MIIALFQVYHTVLERSKFRERHKIAPIIIQMLRLLQVCGQPIRGGSQGYWVVQKHLKMEKETTKKCRYPTPHMVEVYGENSKNRENSQKPSKSPKNRPYGYLKNDKPVPKMHTMALEGKKFQVGKPPWQWHFCNHFILYLRAQIS